MKEGEGCVMTEHDCKTFAIAGGRGFIGGHLSRKLKAMGHRVELLERASNSAKWSAPGRCADYIVHLSSPTSPRDFLESPKTTLMLNSEGTYFLLEMARFHKARFVYASSARVYRGEDPTEPRAVYEQAKRFGEALVKASSINHCILRMWQIYGPYCGLQNGHVIPTFIRQALANEPIELLGGSQLAYFLYIDDAIDGIIKAMLSNEQLVDLGSNGPESLTALAYTVRSLCNSSSEITQRPWQVADERAPNLKAMFNLKWSPQTPLVVGLKHTISYYREATHGNNRETSTIGSGARQSL